MLLKGIRIDNHLVINYLNDGVDHKLDQWINPAEK